jgi:hypothetical protein
MFNLIFFYNRLLSGFFLQRQDLRRLNNVVILENLKSIATAADDLEMPNLEVSNLLDRFGDSITPVLSLIHPFLQPL